MKLFALLASVWLIGMAAPGFGQALLRPGDVFELRLTGMPPEYAVEFASTLTVSEDGTVKVPHLGLLQAAGNSSAQFAREVERKLVAGRIFSDPTALIQPQLASRYVAVGGSVRNSGAVPWSAGLTLSTAIKLAGDKTEYGSLKKVKVIRDGKERYYNLTRAAVDITQNPKLLPGDEVEVSP